MSKEALESLLEKLCRGDDSAAELVFRAYEPYLRMVVRQRLTGALRAKFDSIDIVQSVWVDVLSGFRAEAWRFADVDSLRSFLVRVTLNRFIDRIRQNRASVSRERSLEEVGPEESPPARLSEPGESAEAEELWDQLLELCPPKHRVLLSLKRQGASTAEISERTGLHEGSVRRILAHLARRLATKRREPGTASNLGV